jgi:predicted metalloprotease with PDZ domain
MPAPEALDYTITVGGAPGELSVTLEAPVPAAARAAGRFEMFLPTWTPGSYLIREFARHLSRVEAKDATNSAPLTCRKVAKNRFVVLDTERVERIRVAYRVYAHELTVRTADVTEDHAFWNHACVLLWPVGGDDREARITLDLPANWEVATALPHAPESSKAEPTRQRLTLLARGLDHAIDSPVLTGTLHRVPWTTRGIAHEAVLDGLGSIEPPATLAQDLHCIVEVAADVFGLPLPYERYVFLCLFAADGHGGLEHSESTTLLFSRTSLRSDKGYREFLALAAHELFHAWNVKRLRPVEFWRYDYEQENYTSLLWLLEGWTAYYDDLLCLRAGLLSPTDYLGIVAKSIQSLWNTPGRRQSSLQESSYDAWIRLYRPDENTRNSSLNYYAHGAIAAMCMDLEVRLATNGARCLDHVLRHLYATTYTVGRGFTEQDVWAAFEVIAGTRVAEHAKQLVHEDLEPNLVETLARIGVKLELRETERPHLGLQFDAGATTVGSVTRDSPAHRAGLQPGDEILAIQNLRVTNSTWPDVFQAVAAVGRPLEVLFARRGAVRSTSTTPEAGQGTVTLTLAEASDVIVTLRNGWLPGPRSATTPGR